VPTSYWLFFILRNSHSLQKGFLGGMAIMGNRVALIVFSPKQTLCHQPRCQ